MAEADAHYETARALLGLPADWTVLDDVVWPGRRPADIDHVVVGPGGVFVIISSRTGRSAVVAGLAAADVLAKGAHLRRRLVHPVLCSTDEQTDDEGDVLWCTPETIVAMLLARPQVLERDELGTAQTTVATEVRLERGPRRTLTGGASARRERTAGSTGRLALFLLLVAATVAALPWAAARLDSARAGDPPPTPELGESVRVAGTASRPPLELTAEHVDVVGQRYVVQLVVLNDGDRAFDMSTLDAGLTLDNLHQADAIGPVSTELVGVELRPGRERVVTYRFAVPSGRTPTSFAVAVGDRRAEQTHWVVP